MLIEKRIIGNSVMGIIIAFILLRNTKNILRIKNLIYMNRVWYNHIIQFTMHNNVIC